MSGIPLARIGESQAYFQWVEPPSVTARWTTTVGETALGKPPNH
jgi:hypothetical protein